MEVEIKEDENNGVIIPLEKRIVRSSRLGSTPYDYNLYLVDENETEFTFSINPTWLEDIYNNVILSVTFINGNFCSVCSLDPGFNYDNYSFITNKNGIEDIKTVRVDISFSSCYKDQFNQTHCQSKSDYFPFNWVRS